MKALCGDFMSGCAWFGRIRVMGKKKARSAWVSTKALADELGCTPKHIRESLKDEIFGEGMHYRNINPTAWRPTYRWHLARCLEKFQKVS
jgi:hypothetical protein